MIFISSSPYTVSWRTRCRSTGFHRSRPRIPSRTCAHRSAAGRCHTHARAGRGTSCISLQRSRRGRVMSMTIGVRSVWISLIIPFYQRSNILDFESSRNSKYQPENLNNSCFLHNIHCHSTYAFPICSRRHLSFPSRHCWHVLPSFPITLTHIRRLSLPVSPESLQKQTDSSSRLLLQPPVRHSDAFPVLSAH